MHMPTLTHRIFNNAHLKIVSVFIAYGFWLLLSQSHYTAITYEIPVCSYNVPATHTLKHRDTVSVTLAGKRADLRMLDKDNLAVHLDGSRLIAGKNKMPISSETLFLPEWITLVHYYPANTDITVSVNNQTT